MKKIPTLFERQFSGHKVVGINSNVTPGCEFVLEGKGIATVKIDGACCAVIDGKFYKRYDAKNGKKPPEGAIPCCDPDPITGHWPHWVQVQPDNPADRWFIEALKNRSLDIGSEDGPFGGIMSGTYEAIGPHFQSNPYGLKMDILVRHGMKPAFAERTFEGILKWLQEHEEEGIVFWLDGEPRCKIKRTDFGLEWPVRRGKA